jgi:hypothetical protein
MAVDIASGLSTVASTAQSAFGAVSAGLNTAAALGSALTNLSNPASLLSKIRSINLPIGGEGITSILNSAPSFGGDDASTDWRARLSMPTGSFFDTSPVLKPLWQAGGLIFPYTPTISINHSATYNEMPVTHQNYQFNAYQSSRVSDIQITGEFNVEDQVQAKYWIAAVHFLRSVTKMFTGDTAYAGNPPPVLNFNAYGDHVFRNVPVVVKSFTMSLPKDTNYISTNLASGAGFGLDSISQTANALAFGTAALGANSVASSLSTAANAVSAGSSIIRGLGLSGSAGGQSSSGDSYVPVKSDLTVTLMPVYSRQNVRQFSLQQFVNGAYVGKGYI